MDAIEKRLAAQAKMTPKSGFNLVGVDDYEMEPGEELYLVAHFDDQDEATAALDAKKKANPEGKFYLYSAQ